MKKILFALLVLPLTLLASQILSYNVYDRTDRSDIMLTFDTPYHGVIKQSKTPTKIILKLEDATIESPKIKNVNSHFLRVLTITPLQNETQIIAKVPSGVKLIVSKTSDAYGLRLRFVSQSVQKNTALTQHATQTSSTQTLNLPTKKGEDLSLQYIIVTTLLLVAIAFLFYVRKKIPQKEQTPQTSPQKGWLFQASTKDSAPQKAVSKETTHSPQSDHDTQEVTIRFQKKIDEHNSVVMLEYTNQSYLVLIGNGHTLLDKFVDDKPTTQSEFDAILQSRHQELEQFLGANTTQPHTLEESQQDPLNTYKEKASLFPPFNS